MAKLAQKKAWQRDRALVLHEAFTALEAALQSGAAEPRKAIAACARALQGRLVGEGDTAKPLRASLSTLYREVARWRAGGRTAEALLLKYQKPGAAKPAALVQEVQRRATMPGMANFSVVVHGLAKDWAAGKPIPGLGTWREWWRKDPRTRVLPLPERAPELFGFVSRSTFYSMRPDRPTMLAGTLGAAAARTALPYVSMNYAKLRKGELYTLDDVRLDLIVIDDATGRAIEVICYLMMEVPSRLIGGYVMKPANAIRAEDVDELVAYTLGAIGIGVGYPTHIKFERGTIACSEAAQRVLEGASEGRIRVHRTGMNGGIRWVGAPAERKSGNAAGKAVIESFNRKLHLLLMGLPGQRGNRWDTQPATLGYTGSVNRDGSSSTHAGSLISQAEKLAQFNLLAGGRCRLSLPMLYLSELHTLFKRAIEAHNTSAGHNYQGHGHYAERETAPGVWQRIDTISQ
ncbi:MAG: hypothetical protein PHE83_05740 [Opitutaceae bacterium]|nr:hypothetical protein [Opitutaceae bacterium]